MSGKTRRNLSIGLVAMTLVVIAGVWFAWKRPWRPSSSPRTVRVAYLRIYSELPLFVAEEKEFAARGIRVELVPFESSPNMGAALTSGQVDAIGSIATSSALTIESRDPGRFEVFLVDSETADNYLSSLVVQDDSPIHAVADLKGKTIGSFPGPTKQLFAPMALAKLGLPEGSYTMIELPIGQHEPALAAHKVDAVVTYEPTATEMVMKFHARKLVPALIESNVIDPWQAGMWVVSKDFAGREPATTRAFVEAIYAGLDTVRQDAATAKQALTKYTAIDLSVALQTPNIPFTKIWEVDVKTLQAQANLLEARHILSRHIDVAALLMPRDGLQRPGE